MDNTDPRTGSVTGAAQPIETTGTVGAIDPAAVVMVETNPSAPSASPVSHADLETTRDTILRAVKEHIFTSHEALITVMEEKLATVKADLADAAKHRLSPLIDEMTAGFETEIAKIHEKIEVMRASLSASHGPIR